MQTPHETTKYWPVPMGQGVLVEIEHAEVKSAIHLLNGNTRNLPTARVRAVAPQLPDPVRRALMPDGDGPGQRGARVLISEGNLIYLRETEYEAAGLTYPTPDNGLGDLASTAYDKIIAFVPEEGDLDPAMTVPFLPLGARVFFDYDFDDRSTDEVQLDSGLIVREKSLALENQLATVTAVGPDVEHVSVGDRIIAPMQTGAVTYEGAQFPYVNKETELIGVLREPAARAAAEAAAETA